MVKMVAGLKRGASRRWNVAPIGTVPFRSENVRLFAFHSCLLVFIRVPSRSLFVVPIRHRDESRLLWVVPACGQNDFQWVFLKVWLSRLISGC
jgi:hypothetical protein